MKRASQNGFTLLEVMFALAILGMALVVLIRSSAGNIIAARQAQMMGVATDLARAKMYDVEETLIKDGFNETGLAKDNDKCDKWEKFNEEGWPSIEWCAQVFEVELPSWDQIQQLQKTAMSGSGSGMTGSGMIANAGLGSGSGAGSGGGFMDSALGGMMGMLGGGIGGGSSANVESSVGASFIQGQYQMVQDVLKVSIRKVKLQLRWEVVGLKRDMEVVAFFTDASAMDKVLSGLGSQDLDDVNAAGSGSGSNKGNTGTKTGGTGTRPPTGSGSAK
ncbi:MAG TPA: type II secretion system protein [Kofleriaceae bacterium]